MTGWYYAEYRDRVSAELIALLAEQLGWSTRYRFLDLGAGPGQLSLLIAPFSSLWALRGSVGIRYQTQTPISIHYHQRPFSTVMKNGLLRERN